MKANPLSFIFKEYPVAVETGTYIGKTAFEFAKFFKEVYTIELDEGLFRQASEFLEPIPNVFCYQGDSSHILKTELIEKLNQKNEKVFFYLDAHWSGDDSVDWENSIWKGAWSWTRGRNTAHRGTTHNPTPQEQNPLEEELMYIYNSFKNECVIAIDDWDKMGSDGIGLKNNQFIGEDWSHINYNKILNCIRDRVVGEPTVMADVLWQVADLVGHPPNFPKNEEKDGFGTMLVLKLDKKK